MEGYQYIPKTEKQLRNWFNGKVRLEKIRSMDYGSFTNWYNASEKICHYCGLTEGESQKVVRFGHLKSKRFPTEGIHGRGTSRGMWLEIDRYDPNGLYEIGNIVLCCYFCNNDKSDVFHGDDYKRFVKDRISFLKSFL